MARRTRHERLLVLFGLHSSRRRMTNQRSDGKTFHRRLRIEPLEVRRLLSITVNTLIDVNANDGLTTLREAVATAATSGETIDFSVTGTINLSSLGQILINKNLTINGPGANLLTIKAYDPTPAIKNGDGSRVFLIRDADDVTSIAVAINGLTLTGGDTATYGGAIDNFEDLSVTDCTMTGNSAVSGGAIRSQENMTLVGSTITGNSANNNGGGIYNQDYMTINSSTISNNSAGADGGGIESIGGLAVDGSTISGNSAGGNGGGIYSFSGLFGPTTTITHSTVSDNSAADNGGGVFDAVGLTAISYSTIRDNYSNGDGGGIHLELDGEVSIVGSTISGNSADDGAGIRNNGNLTVSGSTLSGNVASTRGGGIFSNTDLTGMHTTSVVNSTISGNTAATVGGGVYNIDGLTVIRHSTITNNAALPDKGSGVASFGDAATQTEFLSSVVAGNTNSDVDLVDLGGPPVNSLTSNGYNLIGAGNNLAAFGQSGDQTGVADPLLGPLADNGGPTMTHALLAGSPAIDMGDPAAVAGMDGVPTNDQRGAPFTRVSGGPIDIGAFEMQPIPAVAFGDYNQNGEVDAADYIVWRKTLGDAVANFSGADGDGDGTIGSGDYDVWRAHFGETVPVAGAGSGIAEQLVPIDTIPQPAALPRVSALATTEQNVPPQEIASFGTSGPISRRAPRTLPSANPVAVGRFDDHALTAWLASRGRDQRPDSGGVMQSSNNGSLIGTESNTSSDAVDAIFASLATLPVRVGRPM